MYVLNYLFDFTESPANGRFIGDRPFAGNPALGKSSNWLRLRDPEPVSPEPPAFNPDTANWDNLGDKGTLLLSSAALPGSICVRIMPDPTKPALPGATAQIVLAFGRPLKARSGQGAASPFTAGTGGPILTTFSRGPFPMNTPSAWFFPIGIPNLPAVADRNITNHFEFAVGVVITSSGAVIRHYGDDPDMDIGV